MDDTHLRAKFDEFGGAASYRAHVNHVPAYLERSAAPVRAGWVPEGEYTVNWCWGGRTAPAPKEVCMGAQALAALADRYVGSWFDRPVTEG